MGGRLPYDSGTGSLRPSCTDGSAGTSRGPVNVSALVTSRRSPPIVSAFSGHATAGMSDRLLGRVPSPHMAVAAAFFAPHLAAHLIVLPVSPVPRGPGRRARATCGSSLTFSASHASRLPAFPEKRGHEQQSDGSWIHKPECSHVVCQPLGILPDVLWPLIGWFGSKLDLEFYTR